MSYIVFPEETYAFHSVRALNSLSQSHGKAGQRRQRLQIIDRDLALPARFQPQHPDGSRLRREIPGIRRAAGIDHSDVIVASDVLHMRMATDNDVGRLPKVVLHGPRNRPLGHLFRIQDVVH